MCLCSDSMWRGVVEPGEVPEEVQPVSATGAALQHPVLQHQGNTHVPPALADVALLWDQTLMGWRVGHKHDVNAHETIGQDAEGQGEEDQALERPPCAQEGGDLVILSHT